MKAFQEIDGRVKEAVAQEPRAEFIYDLLRAYGLPKAAITRFEKGAYNLAKKPGELLWKNRLFFSVAPTERLRTAIEEARERADVRKQEPRFIIVTVRRESGPLLVVVRGDVAWATSTSTARGTYRDREVHSRGAELMVLVRTSDAWRISAIHWSSRPIRF